MKVITKKERCETTNKPVMDIECGTVFSGSCEDRAFAGVFIKNSGPEFTRLAITGEKGGNPNGTIYNFGDIDINNYKELNACLCIED